MSKRKDRKHLLGIYKLPSARKPYYYHVYLWSDIAHLRDYFEVDDETLAMTSFEPWYVDESTGSVYINPKLGEIHFARTHWNVNIIAHEVQHAIIHRMRLIWPPAHLILLDQYADAEEEIAYETGHWVSNTLKFLTKHDAPNNKIQVPVYTSTIKYPKSTLRLVSSKKD